MGKKIYTATDATYIDKIRDLRNILYAYKLLVGQRPLRDPYDRVLYQNLQAATDSLAKIIKDHAKYRKRPLTNQKDSHIRPRKGLIRRVKQQEVNH